MDLTNLIESIFELIGAKLLREDVIDIFSIVLEVFVNSADFLNDFNIV